MGYTHYWKNKSDIPHDVWLLICDDVEKIIAKSPVPLAHEYDEPGSAPEVKRENADGGGPVIFFNGVGDDGHETFVVTPRAAEFEFCKTANKPYDVVVTAVLLVIADRWDAFTLSSDVDKTDWVDGATLAAHATGRIMHIKL